MSMITIDDFRKVELKIATVKAAEPHPNADRLRLTKVDTGSGELLPIVCGGPNVTLGQKVVVALPGATLYPVNGEPFQIKESKIRGEVSRGMICAEDEIGLGESHDGVIVLPEDATIGGSAADFYGVQEDWIFEIGLTPNRVDASSHYGVARDLAAERPLAEAADDNGDFAVDWHWARLP
jgi:phenylalanyl-tRNA synthetase beta chain